MPELEQVSDRVESGAATLVQLIRECHAAGQPIRLAINGSGASTVADDESIRLLTALADRLAMLEDIRLGSRELDEGRGLSLEQARQRTRQKYGLPL